MFHLLDVERYVSADKILLAPGYCITILREFGTVRVYGEPSRRTNRRNGVGRLGLAPIPGYWNKRFVGE